MSTVYVWDYLEDLTSSWHSGGGLMIITSRDPQEAWADSEAYKDAIRHNDATRRELPEPTMEFDVVGEQMESVTVFPDQGCC